MQTLPEELLSVALFLLLSSHPASDLLPPAQRLVPGGMRPQGAVECREMSQMHERQHLSGNARAVINTQAEIWF
jgi:hypothetical protein